MSCSSSYLLSDGWQVQVRFWSLEHPILIRFVGIHFVGTVLLCWFNELLHSSPMWIDNPIWVVRGMSVKLFLPQLSSPTKALGLIYRDPLSGC